MRGRVVCRAGGLPLTAISAPARGHRQLATTVVPIPQKVKLGTMRSLPESQNSQPEQASGSPAPRSGAFLLARTDHIFGAELCFLVLQDHTIFYLISSTVARGDILMKGVRAQNVLSLVSRAAKLPLWSKQQKLLFSMDWSSIQGSILTGGGRLEELYQPPLFPWRPDELPHYHKVCNET